LAEDFALDEVRQPYLQLVVDELLRRDRKDLCRIVSTGGALVVRNGLTVYFFQRELLGFSDEAENHAPGDKVQSGVEAERTSSSHDGIHSGEGQTKDTSYTGCC
jgi:hypothetical protein